MLVTRIAAIPKKTKFYLASLILPAPSEPILLSSNVLVTEETALDIHDIPDRLVRQDSDHIEVVVQCGDGAVIPKVVGLSRSHVDQAVLFDVLGRRDVAATHVIEALFEVGGLPLPPDAVEVSVMKEEEWIFCQKPLAEDVLIK